jgi:hypothetical protein
MASPFGVRGRDGCFQPPPAVGWDRGADRASNDADVSSIPPIIPYGGFSPVRLEGWPVRRDLPSSSFSLSLLPACASDDWFVFALRASRGRYDGPALCRALGLDHAPPGGWVSLRPRGPRSGPGCSVPVRRHLIGPIRPARGRIAISPHGGLYAMPSLCGSA